ncbi:hypothetical protein VTN96DRAFT_5788 [Rasamsonia emersonii]
MVGAHNTVVLCDNSRLMCMGNKRAVLNETLRRLIQIVLVLNPDRMSMRFLNCNVDSTWNHVKYLNRFQNFLSKVQYYGPTQFGTVLENKVIRPFVLQKAQAGTLRRPVLVTIITDGQPTQEHRSAVKNAILRCKSILNACPGYNERDVSFQFVRVGHSRRAWNFLRSLETDPQVGRLVYCTVEKLDEQIAREGKNSNFSTSLLQMLAVATMRR